MTMNEIFTEAAEDLDGLLSALAEGYQSLSIVLNRFWLRFGPGAPTIRPFA